MSAGTRTRFREAKEGEVALLDDRIRKQVQDALADTVRPVKIVMFTQGEGGALECEFCSETRALAQEVSEQSDKLSFEVLDFEADEARAREYGVDKIPAIVLLGDANGSPKDHGVRFFGLPAGYEFSSLIEGLRALGTGDVKVSETTQQALARLTRPVHLQVFVTPT
jgi:alkyl hydroperoxide reductase subunit AhpF